MLFPILPQMFLVPYLSTRTILPTILALAILPLSLPTSISAKRVICTTWASTGIYVLWLGCIFYAHSKGSLGVSPVWHRRSGLWEVISKCPRHHVGGHCHNYNSTAVIAFVFTSSSTLPLYTALKGSLHHVTTKAGKPRSFKMLSLSSVVTAILLILPLVFISASPDRPVGPFQHRKTHIHLTAIH